MPKSNCSQSVQQNEKIPKQWKVRPSRCWTHAVSYEDRTGPKQHHKLCDNNNEERDQWQNNQRNCGFGEQRREIGYRQRLPEQNAAIAALTVQRIETIKHAYDGSGQY